MSDDRSGPHPAALADNLAASVLAYLLTGPVLFGGIGFGLDRWLGTRFLLPVGVVVGMALALYTVWLRYGMPQDRQQRAGQRVSAIGEERQDEEDS